MAIEIASIWSVLLLLLISLSPITIAKDDVMVHIIKNKNPSYMFISTSMAYSYVMGTHRWSLMMDAILSAICDGGQVICQKQE